MWFSRILAPIITVATLAFAPMANATTVASVDAEGSFDFATVGDGIFVDVTSFTASFNPTIDVTEQRNLRLSASLDIDGFPPISDSILFPNTSIVDLVFGALFILDSISPDILPALDAVAEVIEANTGVATDIGLGLDFLFEASTPFTIGSSTISGPFKFAIGDTGFGDPSGTSTSFALSADISAVPLPASALFLLVGIGGLAATRRLSRKT